MGRETLKTLTHGGARSKAGRRELPAELKRVKIDLRVDSGTFFMLKACGSIEAKGRASTPGAQAARVLDRWHSTSAKERAVEAAEPLESDSQEAGSRKLQITAWVLPATAKAIYSIAIAKDPAKRSQSRTAGLIVERWAAREAISKGVGSEAAL